MAVRRDDQRTKLTRRLLQGALVALLGEKPLRQVTVKELCARAEVNRSTFYLHYCDIYALMEELEGQVTRELETALGAALFSREGDLFACMYTGIFELFARHAQLCTVLLSEHGDKAFVSSLFALGRETCVTEWMRLYPAAGRERVERFYVFVSSGCVGLLQHWFASGCRRPPEEMARHVEALVARSIHVLAETSEQKDVLQPPHCSTPPYGL